jgi:hypothetical protein
VSKAYLPFIQHCPQSSCIVPVLERSVSACIASMLSCRMSLLVEDWVSKAAALQRRGRAGRVRAGTCFCCYTRQRFEHSMRQYAVPEVARVPLEELVLQVSSLNNMNNKLTCRNNIHSGLWWFAPSSAACSSMRCLSLHGCPWRSWCCRCAAVGCKRYITYLNTICNNMRCLRWLSCPWMSWCCR